MANRYLGGNLTSATYRSFLDQATLIGSSRFSVFLERSTDLQNMDKTGKGVALVLLLVDRGAALPEIEILRWRSMGLDNLAYKLLAIMFCEESWASIAGQVA